MIHKELIRRANRSLKMLMANVEIEEAVIRPLEVHERAGIPAPAHAATEFIHLVEGGDPVGFPVEENHGRQFPADEARRTESLGSFRIGDRSAAGPLVAVFTKALKRMSACG